MWARGWRNFTRKARLSSSSLGAVNKLSFCGWLTTGILGGFIIAYWARKMNKRQFPTKYKNNKGWVPNPKLVQIKLHRTNISMKQKIKPLYPWLFFMLCCIFWGIIVMSLGVFQSSMINTYFSQTVNSNSTLWNLNPFWISSSQSSSKLELTALKKMKIRYETNIL